jgi:hypothetical protein
MATLASDGPATARADQTGGVGNPFVSRPFTFPVPGDTLQSVADRVLPDEAGNRDILLGWNPHLALRAPTMDSPGGMLPTDLVYTGPPA